jgi:hypothetical protein
MNSKPLTKQELAEVKANGISKSEARQGRIRLMEINVRLEAELGRRPTAEELMAEVAK